MTADLDLDTDAGDATLPSQQTFTLDATQLGAHTVKENVPAGWTLTDLDCTGDADFSEAGSTATLDIDAGETVICTFTNTKHASLKVIKVTDPASDPQDFDFDLTGLGVTADLDLDTDAGDATLPTPADVHPGCRPAGRPDGQGERPGRLDADRPRLHR